MNNLNELIIDAKNSKDLFFKKIEYLILTINVSKN